jgi:hypothetical protein
MGLSPWESGLIDNNQYNRYEFHTHLQSSGPFPLYHESHVDGGDNSSFSSLCVSEYSTQPDTEVVASGCWQPPCLHSSSWLFALQLDRVCDVGVWLKRSAI